MSDRNTQDLASERSDTVVGPYNRIFYKMKTIKNIPQVVQEIVQLKKSGKKVAFVPTMGALHAGHLALVKKAREIADIVVVSIFVNKAQFNDANDYKKYPRQIDGDLKKLENSGADLVFLPDEKEIYGDDFAFKIHVTKFTDCLCGSARPGHFDGVALIVTKLFNIINPDVAIFGEKDFQQVLIIKKLVRDFNFNIEIIAHEILREKSGLAMSSRNQNLDEANKIKAVQIYKILQEIKSEVKNGENFAQILQNKSQKLLQNGFEKIDYLEIRDEKNLELLHNFDATKNLRIFIAIYLNQVRLIDNLKL